MAEKQASTKRLLLLFLLLTVSADSKPLNREKTWNIIKEVNKGGPYIGLITVIPSEEEAFFAVSGLQLHHKHPSVVLSGRRFLIGKIHDKKVIYVRCGSGLVNAAAVTQQMLDLFEIKGIIHFGIAGNANSSMSIGDVIIPQQFVHTGRWDWLNQNGKVPKDDVAQLEFGSYNVPKGNNVNVLGKIGFGPEEFFSDSGEPNAPTPLLWLPISKPWLNLAAASLEGIKLQQCLNSSLCLPKTPKLVVGLKGSTSNIFVDNFAYRDFLFQTFKVSSVDMESSAVVMTCLSNGYQVMVIRGLSDLAGGGGNPNLVSTFRHLAATNVATTLVQFLMALSLERSHPVHE